MGGMLALVSATPAQSSGDAYHLQQADDWMHHVARQLNQAAKQSPKWHSKREHVQSHVHDIGLLLDLAWQAERRSDREAAEAHVRQVLALIKRAIRKEYLREKDLAPTLTMIRQRWPQVAI